MSIQGINPAYGNAGLVPGLGRTHGGDEPVAPKTRPAETPAGEAYAHVQSAHDLVPTEAPPGTDPALWKVLTTEERAFFARARAMGPLTYGPQRSQQPSVSGTLQGGRIDVRV